MTSDCMDDRQGEAMKPSPSPAAIMDDLTDAQALELAKRVEELVKNNQRGSVFAPGHLEAVTELCDGGFKLAQYILARSKITPSQSDVEAARKEFLAILKVKFGWLQPDPAFEIANEAAKLIAASRGTRALTEEERRCCEEIMSDFANTDRPSYGLARAAVVAEALDRLTKKSTPARALPVTSVENAIVQDMGFDP